MKKGEGNKSKRENKRKEARKKGKGNAQESESKREGSAKEGQRKRAARAKTHEGKRQMSDWRIARVILRTVIALCRAMLKIIGNNEAAQRHCDPADEPDCELPDNFTK